MGIAKKYSKKINDITHRLNRLEKGNIYDINSFDRAAGSLATNIQKLREEIIDLSSKIENNSPSAYDEIAGSIVEKALIKRYFTIDIFRSNIFHIVNNFIRPSLIRERRTQFLGVNSTNV